ncbi:MAG: urease accessory protein [Rhodospirillaceae bacterium]|jgi:ABC-type nickel/cobalt efflux system permease component RcnA|nr:urease accessory protein [Rhodospirillaceae bacterium]
MTSILVLGFLIGIRHAFEPDHVAAVASLTTRATSVRQAVRHGAAWGLGHTLTLFLVCGTVLIFNMTISEHLSHVLEAVVGGMLIILGADVVYRVYRDRVHFHAHRHGDDKAHFHAHSHKDDRQAVHDAERHDHDHRRSFPTRALLVGLMHGMAGSAALIVLAVQTAESVAVGLLYIALFGVGSIAGMALFTVVISIPMRSARTLTWAHNGFQAVIGGGTVALGVFTVVTAVEF